MVHDDNRTIPMTIGSILVPLDGSRLAEGVLPVVAALASRTQATVTLLHVLEEKAPARVHGEPHLIDDTAAEAYLAEKAAQLRAHGVRVETHVHANPLRDVSAGIVDHAKELGVDMIGLAAHGSGGIRGFLFGRVAQQVLRRGDRPVLMHQAAAADAVAEPFSCATIALLLSGTDEAEAAIPAALALSEAFDAELHLVRAVPTVGTLNDARAAAATLIPGTARAMLDIESDEARQYLDSIARRLGEQGVQVRATVVRGDPAGSTVTEAQRMGADLLVLATHGRQGLSGIWAGSVGSKVLERFRKPMVLVPSPRK